MKTLKTNWLIKHALTVFSCVMIIVFGIVFLSQADPLTTTIGENIVTNSMTATGLTVNGSTTMTADLTVQETGDAKINIYSNTDTPTADSKLLVIQKGTTPAELFSVDEDGDVVIANDLSVTRNITTIGNLDIGKIVKPQSIHLQEKERKPLVSFVFDDNYVGQTSILDSKGVKGTIAFVTTWSMDLDEMHTLENSGWEISSHAIDHSKESESDYKDSRDYLRGQGFDVVGFVTPGGGASAEQDKWARRYYGWTRDVVTYSVGYSFYSYLVNQPPINTYHLRGTQTRGHSLTEFQNIIDAVETNNYWVVWMLHSGDMTDNDLSSLIDYIQAKNIDILPVREALEIYGNSIDDKEFQIDSEGYINGTLRTLQTATSRTLVVNGATQQMGTGLGTWTIGSRLRSGNLGAGVSGYLAIPLNQGAHLTKLEQYFWTDDPSATNTITVKEFDIKTVHYPQSIGSETITGNGWFEINLDYIIEQNHFVEIYYEINRTGGTYAYITSPIIHWHYE